MPNLVTINFYEMYEKNKYLKVSKVQLFYKKSYRVVTKDLQINFKIPILMWFCYIYYINI